MNARRMRYPVILCSFLLLFTMSTTLLAQSLGLCPTIAAQSLTDMGVNCANNDTGLACYASGSVDLVTEDSVTNETFNKPGDSIDLGNVISLSPSALNLDDQSWGITVLNMQASLPTNFEQDVVMVGMGGVVIENVVEKADQFQPLAESITITTTDELDIYEATLSDPDDSDVIGRVASGESLPADAVSQDGDWVRVVVNRVPGWISRASVEGDLSVLPTYGPNHLTSFQAFFLTLQDDELCKETPAMVMVQGPDDIPVDIVVNGVTIRVDSSIVLRMNGSQMVIITLSGLAIIDPEGDTPIFVPPGFSLTVDIQTVNDVITFLFGQPGLLTQDQIDLLQIIIRLPSNLLNYVISLPNIVIPSGIGDVIGQVILTDNNALQEARALCDQGVLSSNVCEALGF